MGPTGDHRAISRHLKVLLPPSFSSSSCHKLRISDALARRLDDGGAGAGGTAFVVSPVGGKVWHVAVGRDDDGAFLGRGWPEFVAAHGIGASWFVVFRHDGGGVLTVKAFDTSSCLHEFSRRLIVAANGSDAAIGPRRQQFIKVLLRGFTEKMAIPLKFVRTHLTAGTNSDMPALLNLGGKYWRVEVEKDVSGSVFLSTGWSRFLASNGINEGEALLLRYEGNMVFTVKVFGLDGCEKSFNKPRDEGVTIKKHRVQDAPSSSPAGQREGRRDKRQAPSVAETKAKRPRSNCTYEIGPPSWIKKEIKAYALSNHVPLAGRFCKAIGFSEPCVITLTTTTYSTASGGAAAGSWKVRGCVDSHSTCKLGGRGWTSFCRDNRLREGDVCTFNIVGPTLWHVDIARRS